MGNYISCTLSSPVTMSLIKATKVIFPSGESRRFYEPTKAAELMLEMPNFFLVNAKSLQIGRRFSALNADEDLDIGGVYVFFPMKRLNAAVTAADIGALFIAANTVAKRGSRVLPECGGDSQSSEKSVAAPAAVKLNLVDIEEFSTPEFRQRLSMCRSKKPLLETIVEEPVCMR